MPPTTKRTQNLQRSLTNLAAPLEARRIQTLVAMALTYVVLAFATVWLCRETEDFEAATIGIGLGVLLYPVLSKPFVNAFKNGVMRAAIERLDAGLQYRYKAFIGQESFVASGLFSGAVRKYKGEDLVWGTADGVEFGFSELEVRAVGATRGAPPMFKGLFLEVARAPGAFTRVVIAPCGEEANTTMPAIDLPEHRDFTAVFDVYAESEESARAILTEPVREGLLFFVQTGAGAPRVAFWPGKAFMALPRAENLFEPNLWGSLKSGETLAPLAETLADVINLAPSLGAPEDEPKPGLAPARAKASKSHRRKTPRPALSGIPDLRLVALILYVAGAASLWSGIGGIKQVAAVCLFGDFQTEVWAKVDQVQTIHRRILDDYYTHYHFTVNGQTIRGEGKSDREVHVGGTVRVRYAARLPSLSITSDDETGVEGLVVWGLLTVLGFAAFAVTPTAMLAAIATGRLPSRV